MTEFNAKFSKSYRSAKEIKFKWLEKVLRQKSTIGIYLGNTSENISQKHK